MKVKLSDICDIIKGKTTITKAIVGEYPLVVTGENRLSNNEFQFDCSAICVPLVSATGHGHASIKRVHYQEGKFALGSILAAVIPKSTDEVNPRYLHIYLSYFKDSVLVPLMRGSANVSLTIKSLGSAEIELPSIDKQLEIVRVISKIEEMKDKMDKYLGDQELILSNMRKEILNDAVQGKLVSQNPNDEPVEVLLEKMREEKERLIKEKKIKKEKPLAEISEEENSFKLPNGWKWTRLGDITDYGVNVSAKESEVDDNTWVLELEDIEKDTSKLLKKVMFSERKFKSTKLRFSKNDVLYCKLRPYLNKVILAESEGVCSSEIMPIKGYYNIYPKYLMYMLKRPEFIKYVNKLTYGTKMPRLGTEDARRARIPLAPYNEQKRIVDKIDFLMLLCDKLQKKIEKQRDYSNRLMESILKSSF